MPSKPTPQSRVVSATEFKAHCLALMDEVGRTGDEIIITKHGRAVARLVGPEGGIPSARGWMDGTVTFVGDPTRPDDGWDLNAPILPER